MRIKSLLLSVVLSLFFYTGINAQGLGGHPRDVDWQEINTKHVRVIFPKGLEKKAYRIASIINYENENSTYSVGKKSRKLDLVLQTSQVVSNGFVALAPFRSEFYGTGLQHHTVIGSIDWLDVLSLHEYRHALQYVNGNRGFTKLLSYLQGESGWALGVNFAVPSWYFEGDAVVAETVLSKAGRGRTPSFFRYLRANLLNNKEYSYMTSEAGSLKRMLPDHYKLGYTINNYVRNKYGADVMGKVLANAGSYKTIIYPFSWSMKKYTGKTAPEMYELAYKDLKKQWEDELKNVKLFPTKTITKKSKRTVTNYNFPQLLDDGSIVAIKASYDRIPRIVQLKKVNRKGKKYVKEKTLCNYGIIPTTLFLAENNGKITWTELQKDMRRANRNYARVVVYDMKTGKKRYITSKTKYFSPQYATNSDRVIVVKADEKLQNRLVIIDGRTGQVIKELSNPKNDFLSFPKWANNDTEIVYLAKRNSHLAILKQNIETGETRELTQWTSHVIGTLDVSNDAVYFASAYSGIENIYAVSLNGDKKLRKISSVRVAGAEPTVSKDNKELVLVEFTDMGSILTEMDLTKNANKEEFTYVEPFEMDRYKVVTNKYEHNIFDKIEFKTYPVKPYKGFFKGLKLHSWTVGMEDKNPKLSLSFDNILSNFKANVGAMYNRNEKGMNYFGEALYGKYFVEMGVHARRLNRSTSYFKSADKLGTNTFKENNYGVSLSVPLNWNKATYNYSVRPQVDFDYHKTYDYDKKSNLKSLSFPSITTGVSMSALRMKAKQNLFPRYGATFNAQFQKSLNSDISANKLTVGGAVYLPAIMRNHGIRIDANWRKQKAQNDYQFNDLFNYARGYEARPNDEVYKLSFNYALPLAYPDWGYRGITYFQRVKANLFYDISKMKYNNQSFNQNSFGAEVIFENTLISIIPFKFGLRTSYLMNKDILNPDKKVRFEPVIRIGM